MDPVEILGEAIERAMERPLTNVEVRQALAALGVVAHGYRAHNDELGRLLARGDRMLDETKARRESGK